MSNLLCGGCCANSLNRADTGITVLPNCGVLKFDMKIFVNVARLEIGQLFTQFARWGAAVYFGHISSLNSNCFCTKL